MVPTASRLRQRTDAPGMPRPPCWRPGLIRSPRSRSVHHCHRRKPLRWATDHIGAGVKIWASAEGVPVGVLATGGGDGIEWMLSDRLANGGATLIVGFGLARNFDPQRPGAVDSAVSRFFPEAKLVAFDWHDWVRDPFARGTWVAPVLGAEQALAPATWRMTGSLAFASSDIAPKDAGYLDGAIVSGLRAAEELSRFFGRD